MDIYLVGIRTRVAPDDNKALKLKGRFASLWWWW
jgi:hypothetical protein